MKKEIGLWIDHKKAVIVILGEKGEQVDQIQSNTKKHIRFRGGARMKTPYGAQYFPAEDHMDRQFDEHLNKFYAAVINCIHEAGSIFIFGPGEAKFELEKRIEHQNFRERIAGIENADKMTDRQIAARVRKYFQASK